MKKKVLAAIMAAAVILAGCGGNDGGTSEAPVETMSPVIVEDTPEPSPGPLRSRRRNLRWRKRPGRGCTGAS